MECQECGKSEYKKYADTHEVFDTEYQYICVCGHEWVSSVDEEPKHNQWGIQWDM